MLDYMRAEFYKVFHRRYTYWFLLAMLAGAGLLVAGFAYTNGRGNNVTAGSGINILVMMLVIGVYCTLLIGDLTFSDQYKFNTLKNEVSYGISRMCIYFGKLFVACIMAIILCAVIIAFYLGMCWLLLPHAPTGEGEILQYVGFCILNALPLWIGAQAISMLCLFFIKNSTMASFVFIGIVMLLPAGLKLLAIMIDPVFLTIRSYMLTTPFDSQWVMGDWATFGRNCIIGAGWFAAATLAGVFIFQKREIN